jgi:hypothetical protein
MKTQSDDALRKDRPLCASKCNTYNLFVFGDKADLSIPITWYRLCGTFDDSMILDLSISIQSCSLSGRNGRDDFRQRSTVKRLSVGWPRGLRSRFALMTISPQESHDSRIAHPRITKDGQLKEGEFLECPSLLSRRRLRPFIRLQGGGCNRIYRSQ